MKNLKKNVRMNVQQKEITNISPIKISNGFIGILISMIAFGAFAYIISDGFLPSSLQGFKYIITIFVAYLFFAFAFSMVVFHNDHINIRKIFPNQNIIISFNQVNEVILFKNLSALQYGSIRIKYYSKTRKIKKEIIQLNNSLELLSIYLLFKDNPHIKLILDGEAVKSIIEKFKKNGYKLL